MQLIGCASQLVTLDMYDCGLSMAKTIPLAEIYDKNINFLIGAGASYGLLPTLELDLKDADGNWQSIETLATKFEADDEDDNLALLFMHYYKKCIEPAILFKLEEAKAIPAQNLVVDNYKIFLETLLEVLQRKTDNKRCNVFTTNYDGCFVHVADDILRSGHINFVINDGASGFQKRYIRAKNYNNYTYQSGAFERHQVDIPQINLIHVHGSVYWSKEGESIRVNYDFEANQKSCLDGDGFNELEAFSTILEDETKTPADLPVPNVDITFSEANRLEFWEGYNKLPIVNPTKWKFHETVFEEHYYQMLRLLSYELERPDTVFITFGFSFADEHILNLVKRSLSNPHLQLFVCCFNETERKKMEECFKINRNVTLIEVGKNLDFSTFNSEVFSLTPPATSVA